MRSYDILPTEENLIQALKDNILDRNKDIECFYDLLMAQEAACSIAIDGRWGSGKTFFVKQTILAINAMNPRSQMEDNKRRDIKSRLLLSEASQENYDLAVYFDAWENDNDTDPALSLIYEITKQLSLEYEFEEKSFIDTMAYIAEVISARNVSGLLNNLRGEDPIELFKRQKKLGEKIEQFFSEILIERGERLIVFIDELDRCKPTFAVRLLEQIKHYLCDERITFVFSVNVKELQHTVKQYYGYDFDACRYLDRFFELRIALPQANKSKYYDKIGLSTGYVIENVALRIIDMYNFELRSISRFYRQLKTAVYNPTHRDGGYDFSFQDGKARRFMLMYIVPLVKGLEIVDMVLHDDFVNGKNEKPLLELFDTDDFGGWHLSVLLMNNESLSDEKGKTKASKEELLKKVYSAIFINKYSGRNYSEIIGQCEFDANSKGFVISTASMLSKYADYSI